MSERQCENIIKPFLQIILDASAYGFSWNHSDPYSATGYICGYLRHYHPYEFLTAALNIFGDNLDKTAEITKYANNVGIKVTLPKWGYSRGDYYFDSENKIIAKGLRSIKYMSESIANELYDLSKQRKYNRFVDLLRDIDNCTSLNSRQLDILIKLDFFSEFGNQRELLRIVDMFVKFKKGDAKQIKKSEVDGTELEPIVRRYAVGTTKSGGIAKSYTLLDVMSILREVEDKIKSVNMEDLSDMTKVQNFYDVMGYIGYVSGNVNDRRKLYILDVKPVWLPGSITEKSSVYFEAFYQALVKCGVQISTSINTESMVNQKNGTGYITCITDTYLRGSTLDNAVVIIDEAQNYTVSQLKTVLTRIGSNSKVVVIGHELQCDLEQPTQSGFKRYIEHYTGQERAAFCSLVNNYRGWISRHADELE